MVQLQVSLTAETDGTTLLVAVAGEFDRAATDRFERAFDEALAVAREGIVLDLSAVTFIDVAAVRTLLSANARTCDQGLGLTVVRPTGTASRIFTLTRVGEVLSVTDGDAGSADPPA